MVCVFALALTKIGLKCPRDSQLKQRKEVTFQETPQTT